MVRIDDLTIGVVALQGAFIEHCEILDTLKINNKQIRTVEDFKDVDALILPGGESTAMAKVSSLGGNSIFNEIAKFVKIDKKPCMGTCAGLILLADKVDGQKEGGQMLVGGLNVIASRNYFGAQVKSFEAPMQPPPLPQKEEMEESYMFKEENGILNNHQSKDEMQSKTFNGIFIRAPAILSVGENVEVLNTINVTNEDQENSEVIVAVRQDNILATAFHPELTNDSRWHQYFIEEIILKRRSRGECC